MIAKKDLKIVCRSSIFGVEVVASCLRRWHNAASNFADEHHLYHRYHLLVSSACRRWCLYASSTLLTSRFHCNHYCNANSVPIVRLWHKKYPLKRYEITLEALNFRGICCINLALTTFYAKIIFSLRVVAATIEIPT